MGAGATTGNGETEAAAMLGVGISRVKVWGFLQSDNSGVLLGTSFRF